MYDEYCEEEEFATKQDLKNLVNQVSAVMVDNELGKQLRDKNPDLADGGVKEDLVQFFFKKTNPQKSASQRLADAVLQTRKTLQGGTENKVQEQAPKAAGQEPEKQTESVNTKGQGQDSEYIRERKQRQVEKAGGIY